MNKNKNLLHSPKKWIIGICALPLSLLVLSLFSIENNEIQTLPHYLIYPYAIILLLLLFRSYLKKEKKNRLLHDQICKIKQDSLNQKSAFSNLYQDLEIEKQELQRENSRRKKAEEQIRVILDNTIDSIVTVDDMGVIISANKATEKLFGYKEKELLGKNIKILVPEPHKKNHDQYIQRYKKSRIAKIIGIGREVSGLRKDNSTFPLELSLSEGLINGKSFFTGIMRDISERKEQEDLLHQAVQQAEDANNAKSQFLANMSHEIRTPLNSIIGLSEVLIETPLSEEQMQYIHTLKNSGDSLLYIVNDILDLSKIEAGELELEEIELDFEELVQQVCEILAVRAHEKGLDLIPDFQGAVPKRIQGDPLRIRQILINLISNAIKFTSEGHVILKVRLIDKTEKHCDLQIEVIDTGIGIPKDSISEIFNSFTQSDSSTTRQYGGTGLGLNIVRQLVDGMGGTISVDSTLGVGSTFTIKSTFKYDALSKSNSTTPVRWLENHMVLVIDENSISRDILTRTLNEWGAKVIEKRTIQSAKKIFSKNTEEHFSGNLCILDAGIDESAYIDFLSFLKNGASKNLELSIVLMLRSNHEGKNLTKAKEIYPVHQLLKPFSRSHLTRTIQACLSKTTHKQLLIVDDDIDILETLKESFEPLNVEIDVADDGKEALTLLKRKVYDTVLCDIQLPQMSGTQLLHETKKLDIEVPFIFLSGYDNDEIRKKALKLDAFAYESKPVQQESLSFSIQRALEHGAKLRKQKKHRKPFKVLDDRPLKVLVVDDSVKNRQLVEIFLKETKYETTFASNGLEAFEYAKNTDFDVILMDMQMPIMDGYTSTKKIREWEHLQKKHTVPIIALTAFALKGEREKSMNAGCNDHLTKPIKKTKLIETIVENTKSTV